MLETRTRAVNTKEVIEEKQYYTVGEIAVFLHYSERWVRKVLKEHGFNKTGAKYLVLGEWIKTLVAENTELSELGVVD